MYRYIKKNYRSGNAVCHGGEIVENGGMSKNIKVCVPLAICYLLSALIFASAIFGKP